MEIRSLKALYADGLFRSAIVKRSGDSKTAEGWNLLITKKSGESLAMGTQRAPHKAKVFKSLDAAASAASEIGFSKIEVEL